MKRVVFLDMDGVLVNMMKGITDLYGVDSKYKGLEPWEHVDGWDQTANTLKEILNLEHLSEADVWARVAEAGDDFWSSLEPFDDMWDIIDFAESLATDGVYICSTPTPIGGCASGKLAWIKKHLPIYYHRRYFLTPHKKLLAGKGRFLIDDSDHNVRSWRAAGGIPIMIPMPWNVRKYRPTNMARYLQTALVDDVLDELLPAE